MARPQKEGLDYFPHDVDMDQDDKVIMVTAKYGMEGYGILNKLIQHVYKEHGYYTKWTERERLVFKNRVNVDINTLDGVINECLRWGFFNSEMNDQYNILTSSGFQKRYIEATKRRKEVPMIEQYILVDINEMKEKHKTPIKLINVNGNEVNVNINPVNEHAGSTESTQSKVNRKNLKHIVENDECDAEFEKWYSLYPKEGSVRKKAYDSWKILWRDKKINMEKLISGTRAYINYQNHNEYKICGAQVFLNQQRWNDDWIIKQPVQKKSYQPDSRNTTSQLPLVTLTDEERAENERSIEYIRRKNGVGA